MTLRQAARLTCIPPEATGKTHKRGRPSRLPRAACLLLAALLAAPPAPAQPAPPPRFEVVSVKPTGETFAPTGGRPSPARWVEIHGNRLTWKLPLDLLIMEAFSLEQWQLVAPEWAAAGELFDIQAILPPQAPPPDARPRLQTMLADRFGLKFHREQREIPAFALLAGRNGFKLQPASESSQKAGMTARTSPWVFTATAMSMESFAGALRSRAGRPVFDMTGIEGVYDFDLRPPITPGADPNREMLARIESELGLKLEPRNMIVEFLVVDHLDKTPTPN